VTTIDADVCVVGAGFAGMTAGLRLRQAGRTVAVLEARDRLGGRTFTEYLPDGTPIERGGAWLGPGQDRAYALVAEMGVTTYPTWLEGQNVLVHRGTVHRYRGTMPPAINPLQVASLAQAMLRLDRMAKKIPLDAPWTAPNARRLDGRTLGAWLDGNMLRGPGRDLLWLVMNDIFTSDPSEVSLLQALFLIHSHQDLAHLTTAKNGNQQDRVTGGLGALLDKVRVRIGDGVHLGTPVYAVSQTATGVTVVSKEMTVRARRAVITVPPPLVGRIVFDPLLAPDRASLIARMPIGTIIKVSAVYETAWWRDDGLSGQSLDVDSLLPLTLDGCGATVPSGILNLFSAGPTARRLAALAPAERRQHTVDALTKRFGPKAAALTGYVEQDWSTETWSGGGMFARVGPGVLTEFGPALLPPLGLVHWAGTETASITHGGIDGAIRSGERAADEILRAL
jgi:monoamine oxidase